MIQDQASLLQLEKTQAKYLHHVLHGQKKEARELLHKLVHQGHHLYTIYQHVLEPVQIEVGEKWFRKEINVAEEHLATQITLQEMSRLSSLFTPKPSNEKMILVTATEGESHCVGAKMIADFFALEGFQVSYLGANTPTPDLLSIIEHQQPDLICISITIEKNLPALQDFIKQCKHQTDTPILVGGQAFRSQQAKQMEFHADGYAENASGALQEANFLLKISFKHDSLDDYLLYLGKKIQGLRKQKKISQQELANLAGLDRTYISGVERGKQNLSIGALWKVATALDVTIDDLLIYD